MKIFKDEIEFNICLHGMYENYSLQEIWFKDPDGVTWAFDDIDGLLTGIIDEDDIETVAYENAYEMDMNYMIDAAEALGDAMRGH